MSEQSSSGIVPAVRSGQRGTVPASAGGPLSEYAVGDLVDGEPVTVIWSGGNGPAHYLVARDEGDAEVYVVVPGMPDPHGRMRHYNPLSFVGVERFHTRVWLGHLPITGPADSGRSEP